MKHYYADLHIHIGRTHLGKPVKITGSKSLTIDAIIHTASNIKGLDLIGVIDCHVPEIIREIEMKIQKEEGFEREDGGLQFGRLTFLLGSEIEIYDENCKGPIHVLVFLPTLESMKQFSKWLSCRMKNIHLSSQRLYESGKQLQREIDKLGGLFIPAHIFTPFKSLYGKGVESSLYEVFDPAFIDAVELGLSSNAQMADQIKELHRYAYVTNSDAHSLKTIAREYQKIKMKTPSFHEIKLALHNKDGRKIESNFGLEPRLGKYYRTACQHCYAKKAAGETACVRCGRTKWVKGVYERLQQLKNTDAPRTRRPPYIEQIPLECIPGIGAKTLKKLSSAFGTEMNILHEATFKQLLDAVPENIAKKIIDAREGNIKILEGGGGRYGKLLWLK